MRAVIPNQQSIRIVILSEASRSFIARGAVEGPAVRSRRRQFFATAQGAHSTHQITRLPKIKNVLSTEAADSLTSAAQRRDPCILPLHVSVLPHLAHPRRTCFPAIRLYDQ